MKKQDWISSLFYIAWQPTHRVINVNYVDDLVPACYGAVAFLLLLFAIVLKIEYVEYVEYVEHVEYVE
jgi:hypothetical protein